MKNILKKWLPYVCVGILFIFQLYTQLSLAMNDSQTTDEGIHLSAGYTYWQYKDWRLNPEHPPLIKLLAGFPVYLLQPHEPIGLVNWTKPNAFLYDNWRTDREYGESFLYKVGNNADQILFWSRLPMVGLSIILGFIILAVAWKNWGPTTGVLSYAVYSLDPNFLANGHLVTTDVGLSLFLLVALLAYWWLWQKPSWQRAALFGAAVGLTLASKFTSVIFIPILVATSLFLWRVQPLKISWKQLLSYFGLAAVTAALLVWATYGFDTRPVPQLTMTTGDSSIPIEPVHLPDQPLLADPLRFYQIPTFLHPLLIPRDYYKGLYEVVNHVSFGHSSYLLGEISRTGWWYYFPVAILVKTPLPTLIMIGLLLWWAIKQKNQFSLYLIIASAVYLACAMASKADLGLRHILPIFPPLFLAVGSLVTVKRRYSQYALGALAVWLAAEVLLIAPHYLSYFNQLAGGTESGYKVLVDSNIEWGQDLKRLREYLLNHPEIKKPYIEYYWDGLSSLDYYGIDHQFLSDLNDKPEERKGYAIIGISELVKPEFSWLKSHQLVEKITPSLWLYKMN